MNLRPLKPGEYRYAVAVRDGSELWLAWWVKRSPTGDVYLLPPTLADRKRNPHASYHCSDQRHFKSWDKEILSQQRQPLADKFCGTELVAALVGLAQRTKHLATQPHFLALLKLRRGCWGRDGAVIVDLVEPG
jgi:hypothetical protein